MAPKVISQKKLTKGLVPTTGILSQAPGSLQRASNLLLTQRGSLQTCDGSFTIGNVSSTFHLLLTMGVFNDYAFGSYPYYPVLASNNIATMRLFIGYPGSPPTTIVYTETTDASTIWVTVPLTAALLAPGDPQFAGAGSTTTNYNPSATTGTATATVNTPTPNASGFINFSGWASVALVAGELVNINVVYNDTFSTTGGTGFGEIIFFYSLDGGVTLVQFFTQNAPGSGTAVFTLPAFANLDTLQIECEVTSTLGGSTTTTTTLNITNIFVSVTGVSTLSPYGGVSGQACLIPQVLQFFDTTILILGNGLPPETVDVTLLAAAVATPVTNTFTANYPSWQPTVAWLQGNQISVIISGTTYLFTATQGGVSGSTSPTFPATLGATVTDNQVIWQNSGAVSTSPAPRGAAHGIV